VNEKLNILLEIQSVDIRLNEIKEEKRRIPVGMEKLEKDFNLLKTTTERDQTTLKELKGYMKKTENELEETEIKLKKSMLRLNDVKSNKEYQAILKEIEEIKEINSEKEEKVIRWMEDIEIQEKECAESNLKWEKYEKEYKKKENEFINKKKELDQEEQQLNDERIKLYDKVDKDLLKKYNRLRLNLKNEVVVPVRDSVCYGCHLGIPPQQYNDLIRTNSIQSCPNCNRIVYWGENKGS
jgi:predicted  nucleic acid-binding Zn-ribbon protein